MFFCCPISIWWISCHCNDHAGILMPFAFLDISVLTQHFSRRILNIHEINWLFVTKHSDGIIDYSQLQPSWHLFGNLPGRRNLAPHLAVGPLPLLFPVVLQRRGEDVVPRNRPDDRPQDDVVPRARSRPSESPPARLCKSNRAKNYSQM